MTAVCYLNSEWKAGDGGELRLYPFPSAPVDIPPEAGTVALFASRTMIHRVLPASAQRYCFTVWLSGQPVEAEQDTSDMKSPAMLAWRCVAETGLSHFVVGVPPRRPQS